MSIRRLNYINNDLIIPDNDFLVIDNGCNQTIVNINAFLNDFFGVIQFNVGGGALNSMKFTKLKLVNDSYTLVTLPKNVKVSFKINQAFLDNDLTQTEALL